MSDVKVSKAKCELTSKLLYYIILPYGSLSVIVNELLCQLSLVDFSCIFYCCLTGLICVKNVIFSIGQPVFA